MKRQSLMILSSCHDALRRIVTVDARIELSFMWTSDNFGAASTLVSSFDRPSAGPSDGDAID